MRYGRTSAINFLSQLAMSVAGFVATITLTRTLGPDRYGTYVVVLSVLAWVTVVAQLGLPQAIRKRVSEADGEEYVLAGAIGQLCLYAIVAVGLWLARPYLNAYLEIDATAVLLALLAARLLMDVVRAVLDGQHLVHVSSVLTPVEWTVRSVVQVALVVAGLGIAGAFAGYLVGAVLAAIVGSYFVSTRFALPSRRELSSLRSYAQFSWLASVKSRTFLSMDTLVLALFVTNSLIAIYEVAWNLASLFATFGSSITTTLFPEISRLSSEEGTTGEITGLLRVSLAYSGLFIIPGLVGAAAVGDVVLQIYGPTFDTGYRILLILTFARLLYVYKIQFVNVLDATDHPDLTFRINAAFVGTNLVLNLLLTWQYGWYGAAAATTVSAVLGLVLGYYYARKVLAVVVPVAEIGKQWLSAAIMVAVVYGLRTVVGDSIPIVVVLVAVGGAIYFGALLALSGEFRRTVEANLPTGVVARIQ